jgi:hypothetical protein
MGMFYQMLRPLEVGLAILEARFGAPIISKEQPYEAILFHDQW